MPYQNPVPTRTQWQGIRDKAKVPKGAAKVSIGDSIDKVHKSFSMDTLQANQKATEQLIKDLDSYIKTVKVKYPAFEAIVTKDVKKKAENHLRFVQDMVKAKAEYYPRYSAAEKIWISLKLHNQGKPKDLAAGLMQLKGCVDAFALMEPAWEAKRPKLQGVFQVCDTVPALTDTHKASVEKMFQDLKP